MHITDAAKVGPDLRSWKGCDFDATAWQMWIKAKDATMTKDAWHDSHLPHVVVRYACRDLDQFPQPGKDRDFIIALWKHVPVNIDRSRQYNDHQECLARSSFTALYKWNRSPGCVFRQHKYQFICFTASFLFWLLPRTSGTENRPTTKYNT